MEHIHKTNLSDQGNDLAFWLTKTAAERLGALEELRHVYKKLLLGNSNGKTERIVSIVSHSKNN